MKEIMRKPIQEDIEYLIENIREDDVAELTALDGSTIRQALDETPDLLETSLVWEVEGKVVCLFGITPVDGPLDVNTIWLLATHDFNKHTRLFGRKCKETFNDLIKGHKYLYNYVYAENKKSIRWLKWLGFEVSDPLPIGKDGGMFHKFEIRG